ncbi:MAG TPA: hypothetical protein VF844_14685 [Ktedonobacteraceae bacterium]
MVSSTVKRLVPSRHRAVMTVRGAVIRDVDSSNLPASLKEHIISPAEHKAQE